MAESLPMRATITKIIEKILGVPELLKRALSLRYLYHCHCKIYFCSYSLTEIFGQDFFPRYREFVDWGFCSMVAAMSMLALKINKTARYVFAYAYGDHTRHCWVEFRFMGIWYVVDPLWLKGLTITRRRYYKLTNPETIRICDHQEFWVYQISHDFLRKMRNPQTSWLIWELMVVYRIYKENLFCNNISEVTIENEEIGKQINVQLYYYHPEIIFTRRIVHQMMQHPKATRPKAHTIRMVKAGIKEVRASFEKWLIEHGHTDLLYSNALSD